MSPPDRDARIRLGVALLCALPVWLAYPLPLQDLPSHEQVVALLANGLEWSGLADRMTIDASPRPYALTYFLWAALAKVFGVAASSRLVVSYLLVGGVLGSAALVRAFDPRKEIRSLLVVLFLFTEIYYIGLIPNLLALPTAMWLLARRVPRAEIEPDAPFWTRGLAADAALLLFTYGLHPYTGFLTGVLLLPLALSTPDRWRRMGEVLVVGVPCVAWTALTLLLAPAHENPTLLTIFTDPFHLALDFFGYPISALGSFWFPIAGGVTAALAVVTFLAFGLGALALAQGRPVAHARNPALMPTLGVGLVWFCVCPIEWRYGAMLNLRILPFLFPLLLAAAAATERSRRTLPLTLGAAGVICAVATCAHLLAARELAPIERVIAAMESGAAVAAPQVQVDDHRSQVVLGPRLQLHIHALLRYHVQRGGLSNAPLHLRTAGSPVQLLDPLPLLEPGGPVDPVFRYVIGLPGDAGPPGFRRIDVPGTEWRLFEQAR